MAAFGTLTKRYAITSLRQGLSFVNKHPKL